MRNVEDAALAQHHVEIELPRQALVEPQREVVQRDGLGIEIVRAHDRRVAPGVAAAEPTLLDDRHARAAMGLRQIIGGREAVAAPADDHEIVGRLRLRLAPRLRPALMAAETLAQNPQRGIARAHRPALIGRTPAKVSREWGVSFRRASLNSLRSSAAWPVRRAHRAGSEDRRPWKTLRPRRGAAAWLTRASPYLPDHRARAE